MRKETRTRISSAGAADFAPIGPGEKKIKKETSTKKKSKKRTRWGCR